MSIGLLCIQYVLEEGAENNWFSEDYILWLTISGVVMTAFFVWRQFTYKQPILNLRLFADRNFSIGTIMTLVSGVSLFGGTFILPLYLGQIRHYSAGQVGTTMLVSGVAMFVSSPLCRNVMRFLPTRLTICAGFLITAFAVSLAGHITDDWGFWQFATFQALRGSGVMFAMVATQQLTVSTLRPHQMKDASAIVNVTRNIGGAAGMAMISTILTVQTLVHLNDLSSRISMTSESGQGMLAGLSQLMTEKGVTNPDGAAYKAFAGLMRRDAAVLAFGDAFYALAAAALAAAIIVLFAKSPRTQVSVPQGAH